MSRKEAPREPPSPTQRAKEHERREELRDQARALLSGKHDPVPASLLAGANGRTTGNHHLDGTKALKSLGLHRKSVRGRPVLSGFSPQWLSRPTVFPYSPGQKLSKLSRPVDRKWVQILTSLSTSSVTGGRLIASQGRNLVKVVETLRRHTFLKVDSSGLPLKVREQVIQVVDGDSYCFAQECGMSPSTFYRALQHPLAHLFIRTQKVQAIDSRDSEARRNVATLFSVAIYDPAIPDILEEAFWGEEVRMPGEFVVPHFNCQDDGTKGRPRTTQEQKEPCGKVRTISGASSEDDGLPGSGSNRLRRWLDGAALNSRANQDRVDMSVQELSGCIDRLRNDNPEFWEMAVQIALHFDGSSQAHIPAIAYYKALIHLGEGTVRLCIQRLERWMLKKPDTPTPGRLLTHMLNKEARRQTGFPLRDLGSIVGD